jgi:hypothetical protein
MFCENRTEIWYWYRDVMTILSMFYFPAEEESASKPSVRSY